MTGRPGSGPHGGDAASVARWLGCHVDDILDLSASLNPIAPDLTPIVRRVGGDLRRYPDDHDATERLATTMGVDPARLVLTNGGAEAIALVAGLEQAGRVVPPEFSLYERHLAEISPSAPRWRSNPSNPLGRLADPGDEARVWDEAFWPLATGTWTRGDDGSWRIGSLTKLWACPGVRLGYVIAPDADHARALRDRRPRWSVNALALALVDALLPITDVTDWARAIIRLRGALVEDLGRAGLDVTDTDANWVLVDGAGLRDRLLPAGVVVRDCTSFGMAEVDRIAVPDDIGRARLLEALDATA